MAGSPGGRPSATVVRRLAVLLASVGLVSVACMGDSGDVTATTKATTTTTTVVATTTTIAPTTTASNAAGDSMQPTGVDPAGAQAAIPVPTAEFIAAGVPKPGSFFKNLSADHSLDGTGKYVALTFDDGPSQYTQPILDILVRMNVKATFFELSPQSLKRTEVVKALVAAGMHIGAHSRHHPRLPELTPQFKDDEIFGSIDDLNGLLGAGTVKCFRPPYGRYDQQVLDDVAKRDAATALWSVDTRDWQKPPYQAIAQRAVGGAKDRAVILMHDGGGDRTHTIEALPWIITLLQAQGYKFVPIC